MEDILQYIRNRLRIMGFGKEPDFSWDYDNHSVEAGFTSLLQAFNEYYYLIHVESPLDTDPSIRFSIESDTNDTTHEDFFVNGLPFNIKELSGNISLTNLNTADTITFIFIKVIPEYK